MADTSVQKTVKSAHFIGIGGAGMSGIALVLHERGCKVTGSDLKHSHYVRELEAAGIPVMELARGDEMRYNTTSVSVLWPVREHIRSGQDANELPLVLSIRFGPYTILSASDLSGAYERYAAAPADVLKVAHHGSAASSGEAFLDQVGARVALVSCSSGSRYLPGEATLERLTRSGAQVLRTDDCGDITLTLHGDQLYITPYKVR